MTGDTDDLSEDNNVQEIENEGESHEEVDFTGKERCVVVKVGEWCAVEYESKIYPGEVKSVEAEDKIQVSVMVKAGKYWK